jgi:DNA-binding protein H-NS
MFSSSIEQVLDEREQHDLQATNLCWASKPVLAATEGQQMTASLSELIEQKEALERQIRHAQENARAEALAKARALMSEHGLTLADLTLPPSRKGMNAGAKVAPKYRDPTSGATWSGRGLKPRWLTSALEAGRSLEEFAI